MTGTMAAPSRPSSRSRRAAAARIRSSDSRLPCARAVASFRMMAIMLVHMTHIKRGWFSRHRYLTLSRTSVRIGDMRWDGQGVKVDDGALPGLQRIGFVRTVRTPQFDRITFHEVLCKSALNKVPKARPNAAGKQAPLTLPFNYTVNGYRGCSHACR